MKKLNLEKLKLAAEDVLQRSQLAGIYGGSGESGTCGYLYPPDHPTHPNEETCGWSKATVMNFQATMGGWYCCESCGTSYC